MLSKLWDNILNALSPYKVAVQISGLPRSWKEDYESFKENIFKPLNPDVYIWTWEDADNHNECLDFCRLYNWKKQGKTKTELLINTRFPIISQMKAAKMVAHDINVDNAIPMLFGKWACNELRKSSRKEYDIIILARTELTMDRPLTRNELDLTKTKILIPRGFNAGDGYNDLFAICNPTNADLYTSVYKRLTKLVFDDYVQFNPHNILKRALHGVPVERINYPIYLRRQSTWDK
jgi:hypothetical protein